MEPKLEEAAFKLKIQQETIDDLKKVTFSRLGRLESNLPKVLTSQNLSNGKSE